MASAGPPDTASGGGLAVVQGWRGLLGRRVWLLVWLPIGVIGVLHYATQSEVHWAHDVLRRLYYVPIVAGAFLLGLRGGLGAALVVSVTYLPHAFVHQVRHDPGRGIEKALELVLYFVVGGVAGYLAGLEQRRRAQLQRSVEEQKQLTRQLVRAGRLSALGQVVAGMAHEIKNPLHALAGTAEVVDPLIPADAEERRLWELHMAEIERLRRVAERFLTFASPAPPEAGPLDLRDVAARLAALVGGEARQQSVTLETALPDAPVWVSGDRDQLAQVGMNIVLNGFKALGPAGGRMRLSVARESHEGRAMCVLRIIVFRFNLQFFLPNYSTMSTLVVGPNTKGVKNARARQNQSVPFLPRGQPHGRSGVRTLWAGPGRASAARRRGARGARDRRQVQARAGGGRGGDGLGVPGEAPDPPERRGGQADEAGQR